MAETFTDKLKLSKRDTGDLNWGQGANANLDAMDHHIQQALLRPPRTLTATLGSGGVGANLAGNTAYFYKITAVNAAGETTEGKVPSTVEAQVTQPGTPLPIILQWETVKGATGYKVYKATASGQEKFLASVSGESTSTYTDDGNTAVNPSISVPISNLARTSVSRIIAGSNVTISPTDGTGDVTVNASGGATVSDASDTIKGITKLSVAPASPTAPIAVGDNDPRNSNARTPSGTAGGDLSGSYPNPGVAKVSGVSVPTSPSAGQVLTATSPTAAAWQAPTGGGYATVVVPAATGVAATDTANIQNAINSIGAGTVVLREGFYVVNATIVLKNRMTLRGQGKGEYGQGAPTTIKCDNAMGDVALFDDSGHYDVTLEDFSIDFNGYSRAARTGSYDLRLVGTRPRISRVALANTSGNNGPIYIAASSINEQDSPTVEGCVFIQGKQTGSWMAFIQGKVRGCTFISGTATGGFQSSLVTFGSASTIVGCVFRHNQEYSTGVSGSTVAMNTYPSNGRSGSSITGCVFIQEANTNTRAIQVEDSGSGSVVVNGNFSATGTNVGIISVRSAGGTGKVTVIGNAGFNGYSGGAQAGNDGQTAINSGATAGGDLSGTLPSPTVAKVNGVSVPAAPTAGQVLTATSATAAAWQSPAGGGGYATVVVPAATGVAATDTTNLQAAINSLPTAGGRVMLREGTYVLNTITPKAGMWIQGQGMGTILQLNADPIFTLGSTSYSNLRFSDMKVVITGGGSFASQLAGNPTTHIYERIWFEATTTGGGEISVIRYNGPLRYDIRVIDCYFDVSTDATSNVYCIRVASANTDGFLARGCTFDFTHAAAVSGGCIQGIILNGTIRGNRLIGNNASYFLSTGIDQNLVVADNVIIKNTDPGTDQNKGSAIIFTSNMEDCVFSNNTIEVTGGASYARGFWHYGGTMQRCTFIGNTIKCSSGAVGMDFGLSGSTFTLNAMTGNVSPDIKISSNASSTGNVIVGNRATVADSSGGTNTVASNA